MTTGATDIHTHIVPATFPAYAGRHANARWPSMAPAHDCHHCNVMIAGKVFRTVSDHSWSLERRLEVMEAARVDSVAEVVAAGDTPLDLQAGTNAGLRAVVGVLSGASTAENLRREPHTHIVPSVANLPALLASKL